MRGFVLYGVLSSGSHERRNHEAIRAPGYLRSGRSCLPRYGCTDCLVLDAELVHHSFAGHSRHQPVDIFGSMAERCPE